MHRLSSIFTMGLLCSSLLCGVELNARAAGGGGRAQGRGDAGHAGGRSMQRSPSMSRAAPPSPAARSEGGNQKRAGNQPNKPSQPNKPNASNASRSSSGINRQGANTATKAQMQQFVKDHPTNRLNQSNRTSQLSHSRIEENRNFQQIGKNVRTSVNAQRPNHGTWFNQNFWDKHHYQPAYLNGKINGWHAATATGLGAWLGWQAAPNYYGYSDNYWGPLDYANSVDNQPSYAEQSQQIETATTDSSNDQWLPLGVFAVAKNSQSSASPNMFVQLALNQAGAIAGTFYNATTDQTYALEGWVDPYSQRANWKIADKANAPVVETGVYNLAQSEVPIRVYFPGGRTQDMALIRLPERPGS